MNVEDLLRSSLHTEADTAAPIDNLLDTSVAKGQRKQRLRRTAAVVGTVGAMGIVGGGAVVVANLGADNSQTLKVHPGSDGTSSEPGTAWWQTWTTDRHDGPVDQTFLDNARPDYGEGAGPEAIKVWASGSESDGTDWVMFTSASTGHKVQWLQGWDGSPDYGEGAGTEDPGLTWSSFSTPTKAAHDSATDLQQWLIIVGRPGTKEIDYSPDGQDWTALEVHEGIAVYKVPGGFPPATAKVRLGDENGLYATGTPAGAGAGNQTSPPPDASATPTATPGNGSAEASPASAPPSAAGVVRVSPTPTTK